jgi:hypothetical protein
MTKASMVKISGPPSPLFRWERNRVRALGLRLNGFSDDLILDSVQNTIDKTSRVVGPILLSEVNRFVDGHFRRNLFTIEEFKEGHAQDIQLNNINTV